jgi:steroid delta-isomerase-like uncharacterized protein
VLEQNEEIFRRLIVEGFNKGYLNKLDELFASDFKEHQNGVEPSTLEGLKTMIRELRSVLPDLNVTIEDITADGDKVWARLVGRGTHRGNFMGVPPTGKAVTVDIIDVCRFEEGKIVEHWGVPDRLGMMEQLGTMQRPR